MFLVFSAAFLRLTRVPAKSALFCKKRLVVTIISSLILKSIYKHKKYYNHLQTYLQEIQNTILIKLLKIPS